MYNCYFRTRSYYFQADKIDWSGVISSYIGLPLFLVLWLGYKKKHNTKVVDLMDVDFSTNEKKYLRHEVKIFDKNK